LTQYGFFFDQSRCTACKACTAACMSWNQDTPSPAKWARLFEWEEGTFPNVRLNMLFAPCYHCANPVCVDVAGGALIKEDKYGAVLIDPAKNTSASLRAAWSACPYGAISFASDAPDAVASKCTMCVDRLEQGLQPACVLACLTRALDFGKLADLQAKYGKISDLPGLPSSSTVQPAVVFKARDAKKQLVPYDATGVITLMGNRDPYPAVYTSATAVTDVPAGTVGRSKLVLHASSTAEQSLTTRDDYS